MRVAYAPKRSRSRATAAGHEVQRVELGVRVRQRRAALAALVDEHVHARGAAACARIRVAPDAPSRPRPAPARRSAIEVTGSGALTITSCAPVAGSAVKRSGLRVGAAARRVRRERRVEVRHDAHAPAGRVGRAAVGPHGVDLGRRAVLVAREERVLLGVDRRLAARGRSGRRGGRARAAAMIAFRPVSGSTRTSSRCVVMRRGSGRCPPRAPARRAVAALVDERRLARARRRTR